MRNTYIWSGEHCAYWRENACGYTADIAKAGRWTFEDASSNTSHCGPEKKIELRVWGDRSVANIPDEELIASVFRSLQSGSPRSGGRPMWVAVMDAFTLGSTYAHQLCERFGVDPDKLVRKRR